MNQLQAPSEDKASSPWWRLQGIFFEPTRTFQQINRAPNWLLPVLGTMVVVMLTTLLVVDRIGLENIIRTQISASSQSQQLSEEQLETIVENARENRLLPVLTYGMPVAGPPILVLICAAIFLVSIYIMGGETTFSKIFSVSAHTFFFYNVIQSGLTLMVVLLVQDPETIDLQNPVYSNPGFAVDRKTSPALYVLASSVDIIAFYHMYLLALGFFTVSQKISWPASLGIVVVLWILYVASKTGLMALFG